MAAFISPRGVRVEVDEEVAKALGYKPEGSAEPKPSRKPTTPPSKK